MKRLLLLACIFSTSLLACAPQQLTGDTASWPPPAVEAPDSSAATSVVVDSIDAFIAQIPEDPPPALYQLRETDIHIPPLSEQPPEPEPLQPIGEQGIGLNFENADIHDVTKIVSEITGKSFIVDDGVVGSVTIYSESSLSPEQVFELFKSVLELNGLAITKVGNFYKIVQSEEARKRYLTVGSQVGSITDDLVTQIVKLRYVTGKEVKAALESLIGSDIVIYPDENGNTLIITDLASNVRKLQEIIAEMDVSLYANRHVQIFPVEHADLQDLLADLNEILKVPGAADTLDQMASTPAETEPDTEAASGEAESIAPVVPPGTSTNLYAITRLNALLVSSNNSDVIRLVEKWINILDQPRIGEAVDDQETSNERMNKVYPVKYLKAEDLAPLLVKVYADTNQQQQEAQPESVDAEEQPPEFIENPSTNSLIIRSTPSQYAEILVLLEKLDQRPLQVLIDVIIAEVTLTDSDVFGVRGMLQGQDQLTIGGETNTVNATSETIFEGISGGSGFNYAVAASGRFLAQIRALATESRVRVLSDPHILVRNNETATINIGDNIPITTVTGEGENVQETVEYLPTGIILTVTPQINLEGDVVMEIEQEVSSPGTKESGDLAPPINKTTAKTNLIAQDGSPLVIGGLMSSSGTTSQQGVPLLKDIPWLGRLFRFNESGNSRKELIILVMPRIVRTPEQGWNLTDDVLQKRVKQLEQLFNREETDSDKVKQFLRRQFLLDEE